MSSIVRRGPSAVDGGTKGALSASIRVLLLGLVVAGCATQDGTLRDRATLAELDPRREVRFAEGPPQRVVLISVAGLRAGDYLDPTGGAAAPGEPVRMPNLARLAREGVTGLAARPPSPGASRASHATLVTGVRPPRHGIVAAESVSADGGVTPFRDHRALQVTPLWDAALGRGVVALDWPTTDGARIERLLPERDPFVPGSWAANVARRASPAVHAKLAAIETRERSGGAGGDDGAAGAVWPSPADQDAALVEIACDLLAGEGDAGLWLIRLDQTASVAASDGVGTVAWDEGLAAIDRAIGTLVGCLEATDRLADTAIFVSGDVAYAPVHTSIAPNVALVRAGLIGRDPRAERGIRSWLALAKSHGRSAYVYARDAANAVDARRILEAEARRTQAFGIVPAAELAAAGGDPQAWFGLVARPGYVLGDELVAPAMRAAAKRSVAGILRTGPAAEREGAVGFVAWGRGIRARVRVPELELIDIAPTIASLLGLRLDDAVEGRAILGVLRAAVAPPPAGPRRIDAGR